MNATSPAARRITELDHSTSCDQHRYRYSRIVRLGRHRVRARIQRDFYSTQSCAVAEVLADNMTWTLLATDDPNNWIDDTTPPGQGPIHCATELGPLADTLINRAAAILLD
ncbi:hypothetical protein SacmaDRAFT_5278 [Saccharomonospora marina XMU15]|uniref:Uncharacterized protein n=1 Tax=Saccharomonospora marina XMU15 TaxID=882083 RepID=H5X629_9PSEU|nr:hypothetical protein [Saccharomonospora marina]EHR53428.1 hypothetical protein SacmaDRAFT_5278 [Saccharomonospora marina XMU15]